MGVEEVRKKGAKAVERRRNKEGENGNETKKEGERNKEEKKVRKKGAAET